MVDGKSFGSCLGDLFSVSWVGDGDAVDITSETLNDQFGTVKPARDEEMLRGRIHLLSPSRLLAGAIQVLKKGVDRHGCRVCR